MLVVFPPIFVADTKLIYGYNFVVPLRDAPVYCFHVQVIVKCRWRT